MAQIAKAIRERLSNLPGQAAGISGSSFGVIFRRKSREWLPLIAWPGILAIGLLAVCVSVYFSTIQPLQDRLEIATINTTATSELAKQAVRSERKTGVLPAEQLAEFYEFFPSDKDSPKWIGKIVEVAEKNGISLNHGDYSVARDKAGSLIRIKITLPIQGTYPQIRKYLSTLTAEVPVVSLEDVQFERKDIQDNLLQAKLRLVLYLVRAS